MEPQRPGADGEAATAADGPAQTGRRDFVRALGRDGLRSVGHIAGAVSALSAVPLNVGAELFGANLAEPPATSAPPAPGTTGPRRTGTPGTSTGDPVTALRPWRFDGRTLHVLDQRELPGHRRELPLDSAAAVAASLDTLATPFGMALGEMASMGLAMAARAAVDRPAAELARALGWNLRLLRAARPSSVAVRVALARAEAILGALPAEAVGATFADALADEAAAFAADATAISRALGRAGADRLTRDPARDGDEPLRLLTAGAGGALSGGGSGTVGALIAELALRPGGVRAWVAETRPSLVGARIAALELERVGIPVTILADGAVGALLAQVPIDVVLLTVEGIESGGDVLAVAGTYPIALLAARQGVPVIVVGPSWLVDVDLAAPDGSAPPGGSALPSRPAHELSTIGSTRFTPGRAEAFVPLLDRTPAALVTGLLTEHGLLER